MQNIKVVVIDAGIKFDDEFKSIVERADRREMFEYRNAIIDERKRRQNAWTKVKTDTYRGDSKDLWFAIFELAIAILCIVIAIRDFMRGGGAFILFGVLLILNALICLRRAAALYLRYRGIEIITADQLKAEMAKTKEELESIKYGILRQDSEEILNAKQNQLDSMLGM